MFVFLTRPGFSEWDRLQWLAAGSLLLVLALFVVGCWAAFADLRKRLLVKRGKLLGWRADLAQHS